MANASVNLATAQFSLLDAAAGRAKRGDLIRDGWNVGLLVGIRRDVPAVAWGLVSPTSDRFQACCDRFDHGTPRKKLGGDPRPVTGKTGGR